MRKINLLLVFFTQCFFAQIQFEKGYYIDNNDLKVECFIKNIEWKFNPDEIIVKKDSLTRDTQIKSLATIKEFAVSDLKYTRHTLNIDISNTNTNILSNENTINLVSKTLFLKTLIEGSNNLYIYENKDLTLFFFKSKTNKVEQLIYKKYMNNSSEIFENKQYLRQLFQNINCQKKEYKDYLRINYNKKDLIDLFKKENECNGDLQNTELNKKGFNLIKFKVGINNSNLEIESKPQYYNKIILLDFGNKKSFNIGAEFEHNFNFNKNKWSIFLETNYNSKYKSDINYEYFGNKSSGVNFSTLDLGIGLKYYMFINDNAKLFVSINPVYNYFNDKESKINLVSKTTLSYGIGYNYKKINIECRYKSLDVLPSYMTDTSSFTNIGVVLSYNIFKF